MAEEGEFIDDFGFFMDKKTGEINPEVEASRSKKWASMIKEWEKTGVTPKKVKERSRKGIPKTMRMKAWPLLTGAIKEMKDNPGKYKRLLSVGCSDQAKDIIERDLHRTLPNHSFFRDNQTGGQDILRRVLNAFAAYDSNLDYVQGMGFIVSIMLITQMDEEVVFWSFVQLMYHPRYNMEQLYLPGFPGVQRMKFVLSKLIKQFLPKLDAHFEAEGIIWTHIATQWFLTLYIYQFPNHPHLLMRILDVFMTEGWKVMYRVAVCLLTMEQHTLLKMKMEGILPHLKNLQNNKDAAHVMTEMHKIPLRTAKLDEYGREYDKLKAAGKIVD
eukprot:TRINITY_DN10260_c0_g1_i2.p1 TRINITY_DN10260_c0_g1~~TRINITY_DN10260_c0_g1_i2.p1  ORF type:complete len:341 (+),score=57.91 TRINITY_DN10260_c0_g1_i2:42-1025(+)